MLKFLQDTKDSIEYLFASQILLNFPYYGEFWEKFVGLNRKQDKVLRPYGLDFPLTIKSQARNTIVTRYERICLFHFSMFCELAGAHFQLNQASTALKEGDPRKRHFLFWEAFGDFYIHIGNARFQLLNLWDETRKLLSLALPKKEKGLRKYLLRVNPSLVKTLNNLIATVIRVRNNLVHYARNAYVIIGGKYFIPLPIERNPNIKKMLKARKFKEACYKMENDLNDIEIFLNKVMPYIGGELESYFKSTGIKVLR